MNEKYNYNLSGSSRKPLVETISQILDKPAVYQGAPGFSYRIGDYTIDRNGTLSYSSNIHPDFAAVLINDLQERGFVAEKVTSDNPTEEDTADEVPADETRDTLAENTATETAADETIPEEIVADENAPDTAPNVDVPNKLTVEIPDMGFTPTSRENLKKIVAGKATLLKQALGTDDLPIMELDGKISFPWFTLHGIDGEANAYSRLAAAICNMAKNQRRVTATEKPTDNARFTMRLFLIRLGFIGDEYKTARKILLRNLTGNSSWKSGHKPERLAENAASAETAAVLAAGDPEEPPENKGGEDYGK